MFYRRRQYQLPVNRQIRTCQSTLGKQLQRMCATACSKTCRSRRTKWGVVRWSGVPSTPRRWSGRNKASKRQLTSQTCEGKPLMNREAAGKKKKVATRNCSFFLPIHIFSQVFHYVQCLICFFDHIIVCVLKGDPHMLHTNEVLPSC